MSFCWTLNCSCRKLGLGAEGWAVVGRAEGCQQRHSFFTTKESPFLFDLKTAFNAWWMNMVLVQLLYQRQRLKSALWEPEVRACLGSTMALCAWSYRLKKITAKPGFIFNMFLFSFIRSFEMLHRRLLIVIISTIVISHKHWEKLQLYWI